MNLLSSFLIDSIYNVGIGYERNFTSTLLNAADGHIIFKNPILLGRYNTNCSYYVPFSYLYNNSITSQFTINTRPFRVNIFKGSTRKDIITNYRELIKLLKSTFLCHLMTEIQIEIKDKKGKYYVGNGMIVDANTGIVLVGIYFDTRATEIYKKEEKYNITNGAVVGIDSEGQKYDSIIIPYLLRDLKNLFTKVPIVPMYNKIKKAISPSSFKGRLLEEYSYFMTSRTNEELNRFKRDELSS